MLRKKIYYYSSCLPLTHTTVEECSLALVQLLQLIVVCVYACVRACVHACVCVCVCVLLSHVQLCGTPWTVTNQASLSMKFSRQEYWSRLPFPPPEDLPNPGTEPRSPALREDSLPSNPPEKFQ